jgi:formyltetrahydrofolate-dependent phosphoribosylglycinamide formyltransferase
MKNPARLVVMTSGPGCNLQALIDACEAGQLAAQVVGVISSRADAYGLQRAERRQIPALLCPPTLPREVYDADLAQVVARLKPDWVVLTSWAHLLGMNFLQQFPSRVINLHAALPGQFPGVHPIERAFEAAQQGQINTTGVMVHWVLDERVENGPVLVSQTVPILPDDTLPSLTDRVHAVEHQLVVEAIRKLIAAEGA